MRPRSTNRSVHGPAQAGRPRPQRERGAARKRSGVVLIQLLLPTAGNGSDRAMTAIAQTRRELVEKFKGVTAYVRSPAKGLWTAPDGHTEADDVVMVEVVTDTFDRAWWRTYSARLAQRFAQDTIHVRALPVDVPDGGER